jgi:hypothetical protein
MWIKVIMKETLSRLGISINGKIKSSKGTANPTLIQTIKYESLLINAFLLRTSAVATLKAHIKTYTNQLIYIYHKEFLHLYKT